MPAASLQLLCPKCRSALPWTEGNPLICPGCSTAYPVASGIPIIRANDGYYHELLPRENMQALIERTRSADWCTALGEQISQAPPNKREALHFVFTDENRGAFKAVLPPLGDQRVLDLGCGTGVTSIGLARWAREVVACDLTFERVAFLVLRAREMGFTNIRVLCAGDTRPLPFPDASFDCTILNGVLEWSAAEGDRPVRAGQIEFLREVRRILKPDGHLYIGIENRFGYGYFLGVPEDHTDVKYAALAPRWLADKLVGHAKGHPYRTYTYSYGGMRRLLREAGFDAATFYAPIPDYRRFHEIYALDEAATETREASADWRQKIKGRLERSRWLTPSFGVIASPQRVRTGWVQELAAELRIRCSLPQDGGFPRVIISGTSTAGLIIAMGSEAIVRVPLDPVNEERVARNFSGLKSAQAVAAACTGFGVPRPLLNDTYRGVRYTVESFVSGTPYAKLEPEQRIRCDWRIIDLLIEFNAYQDPDYERMTATEVWRRVVVEPLRALVECFPDPVDRRNGVALLEFAANDVGRPLPTAFMHGDCASGNILFDSKDDRLALVDWDRWAAQDFVTQDFLHFICYRRILLTGCKWLDAFAAWLDGEGADRIEAEATDRFVERLALPAGWKLRAGLAYWVREVNSHHPSKLKLDFDWAQRILRGAMPALLKHFTATARVG